MPLPAAALVVALPLEVACLRFEIDLQQRRRGRRVGCGRLALRRGGRLGEVDLRRRLQLLRLGLRGGGDDESEQRGDNGTSETEHCSLSSYSSDSTVR